MDPASTFTALGDEDCRRILDCIAEEPMTVTELSDICELPSSTTYRKIDMLLDAGLVEEHTRISTDGRHASQYVPSVDRVTIDITGAAVSALEV